MLACQLCATKCWEPLEGGKDIGLGRPRVSGEKVFLSGPDADYVQCVHCKSIALKIMVDPPLLEGPVSLPRWIDKGGGPPLLGPMGGAPGMGTAPGTGFPSPPDPIAQGMQLLREVMPIPVTRLERLVVAMIRGPGEIDVEKVLQTACELEEGLIDAEKPDGAEELG